MILVLIPIKQNISPVLKRRCVDQAEKLVSVFGSHMDIKIDEDGAGDGRVSCHDDRQSYLSDIRQQIVMKNLESKHKRILWVDADIEYDTDTVGKMLLNENDVVAPLVLMDEIPPQELAANAGKDRFYDTNGFIEGGRTTPPLSTIF